MTHFKSLRFHLFIVVFKLVARPRVQQKSGPRRWSIFSPRFIGSLETVKAAAWLFLGGAQTHIHVCRYLFSFGHINKF